MKVTNLEDYPVLLGDRRVIGAFGTPDGTRDYDGTSLTDRDQQRVDRGQLVIVTEPKSKAVTKEPAQPATAPEAPTKEKK